MKRNILLKPNLLLILCLLSFSTLFSQEDAPVLEEIPAGEEPPMEDPELMEEEEVFNPFALMEDSLSLLAEIVLNEKDSVKRFAAAKAFLPLFETALQMPGAYDYAFPNLKQVSMVSPEDGTFRIYTWQLYKSENDYFYYGLIQFKDPEKKIVRLQDKSADAEDLDWAVLSPEDWYGVLYYNIKSYTINGETRYLLFGYDGYMFFEKRKVLDVLRFDGEKIIFGSEDFAEVEEGRDPIKKYRMVLTYAAEISIRLNYDAAMEMIVYDHLIPVKSVYAGQGYSFVPDGSYEGYIFENDMWVWQEKLFDQVSEEPPRPMPILDSRKGKTIMGKEKKGNRQ